MLAACGSGESPMPGGASAPGAEPLATARVERIALALGARGADVDGNRRSDLVWRNTAGTLIGWSMSGAQLSQSGVIGSAGPEWTVLGVGGDYDGDGRTDLVWRHDDGRPAIWLLDGFAARAAAVLPAVPLDWTLVAGTGDYDGDRRSDLMWRNGQGTIAIWHMNGTSVARSSFPASVPLDWAVVEAGGDYDGDGRSDVLWRHSSGTVAIWTMTAGGVPRTTFLPTVGPDWAVLAGAGDYNGDGLSDIVWRHSSGTVVLWTMNGAAIASAAAVTSVGAEWRLIDAAGDQDGDGRSDLVWQDGAGTVMVWRMSGATVVSSATVTTLPAEWRPAVGAGGTRGAYEVSGLLSVSETAAVDSDTNDVNQPGWRSNDTLATAQVVANPVTIVGYLNLPGRGPSGRNQAAGDTADVYRATLQAGQVIELEFASDPSRIDLDLLVFDEAGALVGYGAGTGRYECVRIARGGTYAFAAAIYQGVAGATHYTMRVSAPGAITGCANQTQADAGLIDGEVIAAAGASDPVRAAKSLAAATGGAVLAKGTLQSERLALLRLPESPGARAAAVGEVTARALERLRLAPKSLPLGADSRLLAELPESVRRLVETVIYAKRLAQSGDYAFVVPNERVHALQAGQPVGAWPPNDPLYGNQRWHYEQIALPAAMASVIALPTRPTRRPVVAVIDSGVVADHPDLQGQVVGGFDFVSDPARGLDGDGVDPNPDDLAPSTARTVFHGTHVAGTIAAATGNGNGVAGVAPMALVMPLRALAWDAGAQAVVGSSFDIAEAMRHAAGLPASIPGVPAPTRTADVVNLSLSSARACGEPYASTVQQLLARGVLVVAASGNDAGPVSAPANCPGVIAVAATDAQRQRAPYSNAGLEVSVAAPGGNTAASTTGNGQPDGVYSTSAQWTQGARTPSYRVLQGTSMAAPHVSGVLALMRWVNPAITQAQIRNLLESGALTDDIGAPGRDTSFGFGLINARKAVDAAIATLAPTAGGPGPVPAPSGQIEASPAALDLGATRSEATLVFRRVGASTETITRLDGSSDVITVVANPDAYDPATLLGSYLIRANRDALAPGGTAFPTVTAQTSAGRRITVQVAVQRRAAGLAFGDYGPVYVLAIDADDPNGRTVAMATVAAASGGVYRYTMTVPGTRRITVLAGTDPDNDGFVCDAGEVCGGYPVIGQTRVLEPAVGLTGIDFAVAPQGAIPAAANAPGPGVAGGGPAMRRAREVGAR
jgi:serine protease